MTILSYPEQLEEKTLSVQQNCHPDRSVAYWRDLRFVLT
jgi:hypothetical protein